MKIEKVIEYMKGLQKAGETDVAIGWWDRSTIIEQTEQEISKEDFTNIAEIIDSSDWSDKNYDIQCIARDQLKGE